ncbi:hypothetical protein BCV70DRAFT_97011 [Testicularia cyperi]|uniref:FAS1-like dehydratase domain-containing protein n=1 Tax=Testicularia cyperi TaxID=1882483 RepID=A0A317XQ82_9BASI|nr:hypothetical protein BCV70DRAFT_97011 [Testicularia cyperi]
MFRATTTAVASAAVRPAFGGTIKQAAPRWLHSTALRNSTPNAALQEWTQKIQAQTNTMQDRADLNKARQLALCLPNATTGAKGQTSSKHTTESVLAMSAGDTMPLGSEMVLFNPLLTEEVLGADGTERTFGPPGGLDQRMWASGSFEFEAENQLKIGDNVKCDVVMERVEPKSGAKTGEMVLVTRKLVYSNDQGPVSTERRTHVYRRPRPASERKYVPPSPAPQVAEVEEKASDFGWDFYATRATLFRYSAATFNAHRIHLDPEYCRNEEGHPDCLVHGPLTATLLMNLIAASGPSRLKKFEYRATAPIKVEQTIRLRGAWTESDHRQAELWALNEAGKVCMTARASLY